MTSRRATSWSTSPSARPYRPRPPAAHGPDGARRDSVRLSGGQGAVIVGTFQSPVSIILKPVKAPSVRPHAAKRGATVKVRGLVKRGRKARASKAKVKIRLERRKKSRWVHAATRAARANGKGNFVKLFKGLPSGKYRIKVTPAAKTKQHRPVAKIRTFKVSR